MTKNNLNFTVLIISFLLLALGVNASETVQKAIKIDSKEKALIAPESSIYKWYYNGQRLALSDREIKISLPGTYEVETIDQQGIASISKIQVGVSATGTIIKIFTIGDSTVANYTAAQYPWAGWGQ